MVRLRIRAHSVSTNSIIRRICQFTRSDANIGYTISEEKLKIFFLSRLTLIIFLWTFCCLNSESDFICHSTKRIWQCTFFSFKIKLHYKTMTCFHLNVEKLTRFVYNLSLVKPERFSPKGRPQCAHLKVEGPMKIQDNVPVLAVWVPGQSHWGSNVHCLLDKTPDWNTLFDDHHLSERILLFLCQKQLGKTFLFLFQSFIRFK